jgi:predicted permease
MVALQAALSLVLIIGAGLFLRTIENLRSAPLGYEPEGLLYVKVEPRTGGIPAAQRADFFERAVARLARTPGVLSATATDDAPLAQGDAIFTGTGFHVCAPGYVPPDMSSPSASARSIAPRFFETMRSPMVAGRELEWRDRIGPDYRPGDPLNMVVNEAFAREVFAGQDPIGRRFGWNCPQNPSQATVIGVAANARNVPRQPAMPEMYFPLGGTSAVVTLIARTAGPPERMIATVRRAMADVSAAVPTFGETTPIELREEHMGQERLLSNLLAGFGAVALLLSSIGMYGMLVYMVARRTPEIGIRMALGARRVDVVWMVVSESIGPVAVGLAAGMAGALVAGHWINHMLFGISAYDPWTMVEGAGVFLLIAATAAVLPARRAANINPLRALRAE